MHVAVLKIGRKISSLAGFWKFPFIPAVVDGAIPLQPKTFGFRFTPIRDVLFTGFVRI